MLWFFIALSAPAVSALGHYIDKYLLVKRAISGGVGTITLLSCFFGFIVLPVSIFFDTNIFSASIGEISLLLLSGMTSVLSLMFYLYAIEKEDVVFVIPILQTIPVFGFLFGFFLLGEIITLTQALGSLIVLAGAVTLAVNINVNGKFSLKKRSLALVLSSALLFALSGVIFKLVAIERGFWVSMSWTYLGIISSGILLFIFISSYRKNFISVLRNKRGGMIALNAGAEILAVGSDFLLTFATLLAPISLVYIVNSFHPAFIFVYGSIIALLFPWLLENKVLRENLLQKIFASSIMIIGAIILFL